MNQKAKLNKTINRVISLTLTILLSFVCVDVKLLDNCFDVYAQTQTSYIIPTGITAEYNDTLRWVEIKNPEGNPPGTWEWMSPYEKITEIGIQTFLAKFTPADPTYKPVTNIAIEVNVEKKTPFLFDNPTVWASKGDRLSDIELGNWDDSTAGIWSWMDETIIIEDYGEHIYKAKFVPVNPNYKTLENLDVTVIIEKPEPPVPSGLTASYGQTLADVSFETFNAACKGVWNWETPAQSVGGLGNKRFYASFAADSDSPYKSENNILITITVERGVPLYIVPTGITAIFGQKLSEVTLNNPVGSDSGSWSWMYPEQLVGSLGPNMHKAKFVPENSYCKSVENIDIPVLVTKKMPICDAPQTLTAGINQRLSEVNIPNPDSNTEGTWEWMDDMQSVGNAGVKSFKARFIPKDNNYEAVSDIDIAVRVEIGTEAHPYIINTKEELDNVRNNLSASYKLNADIEFTEADFAEGGEFYNDGKGWEPIGSYSKPFSGTFDGAGHVIKKIQMNQDNSNAGLFNYISGRVTDVGVVDANIIAKDYYAGGIAAELRKSGIIEKCFFSGTIVSSSNTNMETFGGIAGNNYEGTIRQCWNAGDVNGAAVGGITGSNTKGTIENCYNIGNLSGYQVGGIVDEFASGKLLNCYNFGGINTKLRGGEIVKGFRGGEISECYYLKGDLPGIDTGNDLTNACSIDELAVQATYKGFDFENTWKMDTVGLYQLPTLRDLPDCTSFLKQNVTDYAGGYGIKARPYIITNAQQLDNVRKNLSASYKLGNNIDFTAADFAKGGTFYNDGKGWEPIGTDESEFEGIFDGNGYVIKGLKCTQPNQSIAGLFGVSCGTIKHLGMVEGCIEGGKVGGICATNSGLIAECYNAGAIATIYSSAGGIAASNTGKIKDCYNTGEIKFGAKGGWYADECTGGIAGYNTNRSGQNGEIVNCYNIGKIGYTSRRGSIAGAAYSSVTTNCYYANYGVKTIGNLEGTDGMSSLEELKRQETYVGFDFENTWTIDSEAEYCLPTLRHVVNYVAAPRENTTDFAGGYGTYDAPYLIKTTENLNNIRKDLYASYRLENDIIFTSSDFSKKEGIYYNNGNHWEPIGNNENPFYGNFDGGGHVVSGLMIDRETQSYIGLFGYADGVIENVNLVGGKIKGNKCAAGIVGYLGRNGSIKKCGNSSEVTAADCYVGGICGYADGSSKIAKCYNNGEIGSLEKNTSYVGGIAGFAVSIDSCYNVGSIRGIGSNLGGIAGTATKVNNCYNAGNIFGKHRIGGIAGYIRRTITNCYNIGHIQAESNLGAISAIGKETVTQSNCYYLDLYMKAGGSDSEEKITQIGKECTMSQMQKSTTYAGFDFENVWTFADDKSYGMPTLRDIPNFALARTENTIDFEGGYGTKSSPYRIANKQQLSNVRKDLTAAYKLTADIIFKKADFEQGGTFYFEGAGWSPIGSKTQMFSGSFNGNNHSIKGLITYDANRSYVGLFAYLAGEVRNLNMSDYDIKGQYCTGAIAGRNTGDILNCKTSGCIIVSGEGDDTVGGIAGINEGKIYECSSSCTIEGLGRIGGITGSNDGTIERCFFSGSAEGRWYVAGIAGENYGKILSCYNIGTLTASDGGTNGGITAENGYRAEVENCYNAGNLFINPSWNSVTAGGICGRNEGKVSRSYNLGIIQITSENEEDQAQTLAGGGIVGNNTEQASVTECYNIGGVSADSKLTVFIGGIAGKNESTINKSFYLNTFEQGVGKNNNAAETTKCSTEELKNAETYGTAFDFDYDMIWSISDTAEYKFPILTEVVNPELQYTLSAGARQGMAETPTAESYGNGKITVKAISGQKYVCVQDADKGNSGEIPAFSSSEWKSASGSTLVFSGLTQGKTYRVYTYIPAVGGQSASYISQPLVVTLKAVGDLGGDGKIDSSDALYLRRAIAGWDGYELNFSAADINADEKLTVDDIMYLERHIAGWKGYETLPVKKSDFIGG